MKRANLDQLGLSPGDHRSRFRETRLGPRSEVLRCGEQDAQKIILPSIPGTREVGSQLSTSIHPTPATRRRTLPTATLQHYILVRHLPLIYTRGFQLVLSQGPPFWLESNPRPTDVSASQTCVRYYVYVCVRACMWIEGSFNIWFSMLVLFKNLKQIEKNLCRKQQKRLIFSA